MLQIWNSLKRQSFNTFINNKVTLFSRYIDLDVWIVAFPTWLSFLFSWIFLDPFDLNHNLGAGLSRKSKLTLFINITLIFFSFNPSNWAFILFFLVTNFIMKAFINGRRVFGIPVKGFPKDYPSKMVSVCWKYKKKFLKAITKHLICTHYFINYLHTVYT